MIGVSQQYRMLPLQTLWQVSRLQRIRPGFSIICRCRGCAPPQLLQTNMIIDGIGDKYRVIEHFAPWTYPG